MKNIRNFTILSHIDHGKSTLADRFLEITETIEKSKMQDQYLDMMDLERERGITIKMQPVRMKYRFKNEDFILNLIDTPGHADFSYEVSRSLAAVEGTILLVDAVKGIQAQTISNLELAQKEKLKIIPVINKVDLPQANVEQTKQEISELLDIPKQDILSISAKEGTNIKELLEYVIENIPGPEQDYDKSFKALIFDSEYDSFKGVIAYVRVIDGKVLAGDKMHLLAGNVSSLVKEVGFFNPKLSPKQELKSGEIGYIATGIKEPGRVKVGDTIIKMPNDKSSVANVKALPGYKEPNSMVFVSIYPKKPNEFKLLEKSLDRLKLNDPALTFKAERKEYLGRGFFCGFLGSLHIEIISERLRREFGLDLIISNPSLSYKMIDNNDKEFIIRSPGQWPNPSLIKKSKELWTKLEVITPNRFFSQISDILKDSEGEYIETKYLGSDKMILFYQLPLREVIVGLYDRLKSISQGFASLNYEVSESELEWREIDLIKLEILVAGKKEEVFSKIVPKEKAEEYGRAFIKRLKDVLPTQQFSVSLQAVVGGSVIARETISSRRKDVTGYLYGGDYSRKRKLLEKQKKGKKKLKEKGRIQIPSKVYLKMFGA